MAGVRRTGTVEQLIWGHPFVRASVTFIPVVGHVSASVPPADGARLPKVSAASVGRPSSKLLTVAVVGADSELVAVSVLSVAMVTANGALHSVMGEAFDLGESQWLKVRFVAT